MTLKIPARCSGLLFCCIHNFNFGWHLKSSSFNSCKIVSMLCIMYVTCLCIHGYWNSTRFKQHVFMMPMLVEVLRSNTSMPWYFRELWLCFCVSVYDREWHKWTFNLHELIWLKLLIIISSYVPILIIDQNVVVYSQQTELYINIQHNINMCPVHC